MRQRLSILVILALVLASAILPAAATARAAELSLSVSENGTGGSLLVTGAGFAANTYVALWWDISTGEAAAVTMTDATGAFSGVSVTPPATGNGIHLLYASDGITTASAIAGGMLVTTLTVTPDSMMAGGAASVSGEHFTPGAVVTIRWDAPGGAVLGSVTANAAGAFTNLAVIIPATAGAGVHALYALDNMRYASAALIVPVAQATLGVSPAAQIAGGPVWAAGTGYAPGETVSLRWEGIAGVELSSVVADGAGAFAGAHLIIPTTAAAGAHTIIGLGSASLRQAATSVTVTVATLAPEGGSLTGIVVNAETGARLAGAVALLQPMLSNGTGVQNGAGAPSQGVATGQNGVAGRPEGASAGQNGTGVQNGASGQPEGGAAGQNGAGVQNGAAAGQNGAGGQPDGAATVQTSSEADGSFSFTGLAQGMYRLRVTARGFQGSTTENIAILAGETAVVNVALHPSGAPDEERPAAKIGGRVTNQATGKPIAKAAVLFTPTGGDDDHRRGRWFGFARTNSDGVYLLENVRPGTYTLIAVAIGYRAERVGPVTVSDGAAVRVNFTLEGRANRNDDDDDGRDGKRSGWGCGDRNHEHTGPQGRGGDRESPCDQADDDDENGADRKDHGRNRKPGSVGANGAEAATNGAVSVDAAETNGGVTAGVAVRDRDGKHGKGKGSKK